MTRDEAIKVLSNISTVGRLNGKHLIIKALQMAIEALERQHGEWIESDFGWRCSICGNTSVMWQRTYNFCPNCGADMRDDNE